MGVFCSKFSFLLIVSHTNVNCQLADIHYYKNVDSTLHIIHGFSKFIKKPCTTLVLLNSEIAMENVHGYLLTTPCSSVWLNDRV